MIMSHSKKIQLSLCVGLLLVAAACNKNSANTTAGTAGVRVTDVTLGRSVGGDKAVTDRTESFKPGDTIYASVATEGSAPSATLRAKWLFEDGQLVDESTRAIAPTNLERTEFHISKPGGWPVGKYKVEVFLNDQSTGTKSFEVKGSVP
jgi:hypothetical protein